MDMVEHDEEVGTRLTSNGNTATARVDYGDAGNLVITVSPPAQSSALPHV
jgi:hypothetical protein